MVEPTEMPCGMVTRVGPKNACIIWGADPPGEDTILEKSDGHCKVLM